MTESLKMMIDHVSLSVEDLPRAKVFYSKLLATLGLEIVGEFSADQTGGDAVIGFGIEPKGQLWLSDDGPQSPHAHICFRADTRQEVRDFHAAGLAAGGEDNGAPGIREIYHPSYYAAFIIDFDGHNIEAVCCEPET